MKGGKQEVKNSPKSCIFYIQNYFFFFLNKQSVCFEHFLLFVCFPQTRFTFYTSSNRQGGKQTAAILYLESFAQVLALPNAIANKEWQLVPSAVLFFLIWITSQTFSATNRSFLIDIKLDQLLVTSAPGQIWLQPVTCKSSIRRLLLPAKTPR